MRISSPRLRLSYRGDYPLANVIEREALPSTESLASCTSVLDTQNYVVIILYAIYKSKALKKHCLIFYFKNTLVRQNFMRSNFK